MSEPVHLCGEGLLMRNPRTGEEKMLDACPCCGNENLYHGHASATSMGIRCWPHGGGCGLKIEIDIFDLAEQLGRQSYRGMEWRALLEAAERWNRRTTG